ncbi:MAG: hypothetical protein K8R59_10730 [Thermoanaerobaculales bacterium]|nr:hypothetical protein [Thermoanaerobaculales bacterium]
MSREFWWNADFDLALQPGWKASSEPGLGAQIRELGHHALLAASPDDSVLLAQAPPEGFLSYLVQNGLEPPKTSILPELRPAAEFTPYGWSPQAVALRGRYDYPSPHPKMEIIRRVNSRIFGHELERDAFASPTPRGSFSTVDELVSILADEPEWPHGWVVKTMHGNAALGNRKIRSRKPTKEDHTWLSGALVRGEMVLERWLPREVDMCAVFEVTESGAVTAPRLHETIHTAEGGFIGALFDPDSTWLRPWREELSTHALKIGSALAGEGYFGPVCIDALVWRKNNRLQLRPLVEINARRHVSEGWARLAREWGGCVYGRFFSARKLRLPQGYREFHEALGGDAWDRRSRHGALLTSPLSFEDQGHRRRPRKLSVLFRGSGRDEVMAMEERFRDLFER